MESDWLEIAPTHLVVRIKHPLYPVIWESWHHWSELQGDDERTWNYEIRELADCNQVKERVLWFQITGVGDLDAVRLFWHRLQRRANKALWQGNGNTEKETKKQVKG